MSYSQESLKHNLLENPQRNYPLFIQETYFLFGNYCTFLRHGLLGFWLDDEAWASLPDNATVDEFGDVVFADRPEIPTLGAEPAANASDAALKRYQIKAVNHREMMDKLSIVRSRILLSLHPSDEAALRHPISGMHTVTLRQIFDHIKLAHGSMDQANYAELDKTLDQRMGDSEVFKDIVARHSQVYATYAANETIYPEKFKLEKLIAATCHLPHIQKAFDSYVTANPSIRQRTFGAAADYVAQQAPNLAATAGDMGYAAHVANQATKIQQLEAQLAALTAHTHTPTTPPYCHLHGYGSHTSQSCKAMAADPAKYTAKMRSATRPDTQEIRKRR